MKSYGVSKGFGKCCTILTLNFRFGWILDKFIPYEIDHQPPPPEKCFKFTDPSMQCSRCVCFWN